MYSTGYVTRHNGVTFITFSNIICYKTPTYTWRHTMKILGQYQRILSTDPILKEQCCICLETYKTGEYKRILPKCEHLFHKKCIDKWLRVGHGMKCPICRYDYSGYKR